MQTQDAKIMSKKEDEKKVYAHIIASSVEVRDTLPLSVLPSLRRRLKQSMRGKAMRSTACVRKKRLIQRGSATHAEKGDTWHIHVPLGNTPKSISINNNFMLRKDGKGTFFVAIAKHPTTHTKAMPKYVAPNLRGPKIVWVPSKSG